MRKKKFRYGKYARMLAMILMACMLGTSLPATGLSSVHAGSTGTTVLDFNGTDFDTTLHYGGSITKTASAATLVADTTNVPEGFSDGVYAGGDASYAATAVKFDKPLDLSKVTSVKVRIYIPSYSYSSTPSMRVIDTSESTSVGYKEVAFPTFDQWCEIEMLSALTHQNITKNVDGYLERFVIAYRTRAAVTVYFDSIIIEYNDENYFVDDNTGEDMTTDYQVTLTSLSSWKYRDHDNCLLIYMNYTGTLPQDYEYHVNVIIDGKETTYRLWRNSDTECFIGIHDGKHPTSSVKFSSGKLIRKDSTAPSVALAEDYSLSCIDGKIVEYLPEVNAWTNISVAQAFGGVPVTLTEKTGSDITTFDKTEFKYTGNFLPEAASSEVKIFIGTPKTDLWKGGFLFHLKQGENSFAVYDYTAGISTTKMKNKINNSTSVNLKDVYADYTDTTPTAFKFRIQYVDDDVYVLVFVEEHLAGVYCLEGRVSAFGDRILGYSTGGSYYVQSYINNNYWDATIETIDSDSRANGDHWDIYPRPLEPKNVPGTKWSTKFKNVAYEVDGVPYTADFVRAGDSEGLYMSVPGTILEPGADGVTVVIKAGKYPSNDGSDGIHIPEDFTFYAIKGALTAEFDFDDPSFTSDVYCNTDADSYTVTDADTVTIDGETYQRGEAYTKVGVHTLTYTMYNREYSRRLIIYRYGDLNDDGTVSAVDLIRAKKHLDEDEAFELTESALKGADMNCDDNKSNIDVTLLRKYLVLEKGILLLSPEDNIVAAMASEQVKAMETNYTPGMSVNLLTGTDTYHRTAIEINWLSMEDVSEYRVLLAEKNDFSDAVTYTTTTTTLSLINLLPDTTYYWKLEGGDYETEVRTFHTEDTIRTLTIEGVTRTRDCGGYDVPGGKKVKYGMIYRGGKLDNLTEEGLYQMLTVLGTKTDLDLRVPGEGSAGGTSPLGDTVKYLNYSGPYYWPRLIEESYKEALVAEIKAFADESNYPIYVHCSIGRDRTGTIILLINGLLGVSKDDLYLDYELSFLSAAADSASVENMMNTFTTMYDEIQKYAPDGTFADACETFMKDYCGITQDEINTIRQLLVE